MKSEDLENYIMLDNYANENGRPPGRSDEDPNKTT